MINMVDEFNSYRSKMNDKILNEDNKVTIIRAPDAPIGWPKAQAPPLIFTLSLGISKSCIADIVTTAKASLIS